MNNPFRSRNNGEGGTVHTIQPKVDVDFMKRVWDAPADYNRAARDREALGIPADLPPRYVRRHFNSERFIQPKTRRQRKQRARILRAMAQ